MLGAAAADRLYDLLDAGHVAVASVIAATVPASSPVD
jgi:hypothetical protein